ncbi:MAG: hypothetical protein JWP29_1993 [Rhodoferax sp.]|nr:hypothetical protein [Rhodoferax sp.]
MTDVQQTADVISGLRWLDNANLGVTPGDDEAVSAVCESAIEEIERLRAGIDAAIGEFERGKPLSAYNFLLNAKEGLQ